MIPVGKEDFLWSRLARAQKPVVLYGMGDGADKILAVCERYGVRVSGVFASPGFVRGHSFRGFAVERLDELEERLGNLIVLLCFATQRPQVLAQIETIAARHELCAPDVPVYGDTLVTPDYLTGHQAELEQLHSLLADGQSRRVLEGILEYKITGRLPPLRACETPRQEVWDSLLRPIDREVFVDCGAYNGDTVEEFYGQRGGRYEKIIALEPDRRSYKKLKQRAEKLSLQHCACRNLGAWSGPDTLPFRQTAGRQAALGGTSSPVPVDSVDNILRGERATLIKYDVEGAEREALLGSRETIARWSPRLSVSVYHRGEDLFSLPLLVHELNPAYKLYLRHHPYLPAWDTNLLAIPS